MRPLLILFCSILVTFLVSRCIAYAVLVWHVLPERILSNGRRPHHFVYGNFLIVAASFAVFGLQASPSSSILLVMYGIGLGLVLDEFPHWLGNTKELQRNVPIVQGGLIATSVVLVYLLMLMVLV